LTVVAVSGGGRARYLCRSSVMKRQCLFGSLAIAAASFFSSPVAAQDTLQRSGALARTPSYASLTAALAATSTATELVGKRMVIATDIRVVDANTVIGSDNAEMVKSALEQHRDHIAQLRDAISQNVAYTTALAAHKDQPQAEHVIAVDILVSGDVLVYFRK
jgi:hypothetical protein